MASKLRRAPLFPYNETSVFLTTSGIPSSKVDGLGFRAPTPMTDMGATRYFMCGICSGVAFGLATHPIHVMQMAVATLPIRTQRKTYSTLFRYVTVMLKSLEDEARRRGVRGVYKGLGTHLLLVAPAYTACFTGFGIGLEVFRCNERGSECTYEQIFAAGCFSSVVSTPVVTPLESIRAAVSTEQHRSKRVYTGSLQCTLHWLRQLGLPHLYRFTALTLVRDAPGKGAFYLTYEYVLDSVKAWRKTEATTAEIVVAGGLSGAAYRLVTLPFDKVKAVLYRETMEKQGPAKYGPGQILRDIYRQRGPRALFHGLGGLLLVSIPGTAGCFLGFEWTKKLLDYCFPLNPAG